ncbi:hypothetical protein Tneu_0253 [Pyrobaculum neutrophilum V24Sta]|uniref:Uncharacterized protein n=1 Tax=Pyrobaculum neutrophilum (strain DSM 2338 / JCM 9278 / NBRC 100436 / V24Sta) TaxID=444157 RepID=B1YB75_PYRNV|nr:hypothetical protein Tneu_0253 [Pyrobaculum neutrophilum V24Sta]
MLDLQRHDLQALLESLEAGGYVKRVATPSACSPQRRV